MSSVTARIISVPFGFVPHADGSGEVIFWAAFSFELSAGASVASEVADWPKVPASLLLQFPNPGPQQKVRALYKEGDGRLTRVAHLDSQASALWGALFPSHTAVRDRAKLAQLPALKSYKVAEVHKAVQGTYGTLAGQSNATGGAATRALPTSDVVRQNLPNGVELDRLRDFHAIEAARAPVKPTYDFHERLSIVSHYPSLMRAMGLLVELRLALEKDALADLAAMPDKRVRIEPQWLSSIQPDKAAPWTRFVFEPMAVRSTVYRCLAGRDPALTAAQADHDRGFLRIAAKDRFDHCTVDVVAAVHQLDVLASTLQSPSSTVGTPTAPPPVGAAAPQPADETLPLLRSNGISVFRKNRDAEGLAPRLKRSSDFEKLSDLAKNDTTLTGDDLIRGYAVDVLVDGGDWLSLCLQQVQYRVGGVPFPAPEPSGVPKRLAEEGFVGTSAVQSADGKAVKIHENLFTWDGWSLSVPRPPCINAADVNCSAASEAAIEADIVHAQPEVECKSLPQLRFGRKYKLRARTVDVAGNRWHPNGTGPLSAASHFTGADAAVTEDITHLRYQVPRPPSLYAVEDASTGASADPDTRDVSRLVYRSGDKFVAYFLAPPPLSLDLMIEHGAFDPCDINKFNDAVGRTKQAALQPRWSDIFKGGQYPFFADPIVAGACVRGLPTKNGKNDGMHVVPFAGPKDTKVILYPETAHFLYDGKPRTGNDLSLLRGSELHVFIPAGLDTALLLSSCIDRDKVKLLGMIHYPGTNGVEAAATTGTNEIVCPARQLRLVHAVGSPAAPTQVAITVSRQPFQAEAAISCTATLDQAQVGTLDLDGTWKEIVDDLSANGPRTVDSTGSSAKQVTLPYQLPGARDGVALTTHVFRDTKAREVKYVARAGSRYGALFATQPPPSSVAVSSSVTVPASAAPDAPKVVSVVPTFGWHDHRRDGFGVRVYLGRPWFSSGVGEMLAVVLPGPGAQPVDVVGKKPYVSQWGRDPVWRDGPLQAVGTLLTPKNFSNATSMDLKGLKIRAKGGDWEAVDAAVYEIDSPANYSPELRMWWCDLNFDLGQRKGETLYTPFVRLALARYQPSGLVVGATVDCRLSSVVTTDFVQLANDRVAQVTRSGETVSIVLSGAFPADAANRMRVDAVCQEHGEDAPVDMGWTDVVCRPEEGQCKNPKPLTYSEAGGRQQWACKEWILPGVGRRRVVLREYEQYDSSDGAGRDERVVYFDTFDM